jgi:putative DNA primase/helicase
MFASRHGQAIRRLFEGDTSAYEGDDSRADLALCAHLAFWTGNDRSRIDTLFRASGLYREKWEREDYREGTMTKATQSGSVLAVSPGPSRRSTGLGVVGDGQALTDLGNAERFAQRWRDALLYCHSTGRWLVWDGRRWKPDDDGTPVRCAGISAREFAASLGPGADRYQMSFAKQSESRGRIEATLALAQSSIDLVVRADHLDAEPMLLNTPNGTVDLRSGELRPHRPSDRLTRLAGAGFDPSAVCPRFEAFLNEVFGGDAELIGFVQRLFGLCLTADVREQFLPIFHGNGANGKSVLVDTVMSVMGDYADVAPPGLLEDRGRDEHPTEIADLMGKRLVVSSETEDGTKLKLQLVKRLTGDSVLKGRFMRQDYFSFPRTHKTILVTNNRPQIGEDTEAVWRRIVLVPFLVTIPPEKRDATLGETLRGEAPGILAWMVRGCHEWIRNGLNTPGSIMAATNGYRSDEDCVGRFLADRCVVGLPADDGDPEYFTPWRVLYAEYQQWSEEAGVRPFDAARFGLALDRRGLKTATRRVDGVPSKGRPGIRLRSALAGPVLGGALDHDPSRA